MARDFLPHKKADFSFIIQAKIFRKALQEIAICVKVGKMCIRDRYLVLPFLSAFMLGNPMSFTMARFLPEYYKPSYYAAQAQFCHTSNGVFPHINPGELFVWLGIAQGIDTLGLNSMDLAIRYMFVGILMNFIGGWVTDFTTAYVCKQQGITLSKTVEIAVD